MAKEAEGFGVALGAELIMATVGPTRRSAIVNWLYAHGWPFYNFTTDLEIEAMWQRAVLNSKISPLNVVKVKVVEVESA